jgi:hypothetical protein
VVNDEAPPGAPIGRRRARRLLLLLYGVGLLELVAAALVGVISASAQTAFLVALALGGVDMLLGVLILLTVARRTAS